MYNLKSIPKDRTLFGKFFRGNFIYNKTKYEKKTKLLAKTLRPNKKAAMKSFSKICHSNVKVVSPLAYKINTHNISGVTDKRVVMANYESLTNFI